MKNLLAKIARFFGLVKRADDNPICKKDDIFFDDEENWTNEEDLYNFMNVWLSELLGVDVSICKTYVESAVFLGGLNLEHNRPLVLYVPREKFFYVVLPQKDAISLRSFDEMRRYAENADWFAGWYKRGSDMLWYNFFKEVPLGQIKTYFQAQIYTYFDFAYEDFIPKNTAAKFKVLDKIKEKFNETHPGLIANIEYFSVCASKTRDEIHVYPVMNKPELVAKNMARTVSLAITNEMALYLEYHPDKMDEVVKNAIIVFHNYCGPDCPYVEKGQDFENYYGEDPWEFWKEKCPLIVKSWMKN